MRIFSAERPTEVPLHQATNEDNAELVADLRDKLAQSEDECTSLRQRLDEFEREFRETLNDQRTNLGVYEETIEKLTRERSSLLEQLETAKPSEANEKLEKVAGKLKKVLKTTKDKINQIVVENPELFDGVSEDMNDRLDHLISTIRNQAAQIAHRQPDWDNDWSQR